MSKRKFPIVVKRGNVRVKVYATPSNGCPAYTVAYYFASKRVRKTFGDLGKAKLEAETVANRICAGELNVLTLTSEDRTAYVRAMEMLKPSGTPLEIAVMQFAEAERILQGRSLVEAAKFFAKHNSRAVVQKRLPDVVVEMLAARESEGASERHIQTLRCRLRRLAAAFSAPINMILGSELQDYLRDLKTVSRKAKKGGKSVPKPFSAESKNNGRKAIQNLFHFAQSRGYLPKGLTEADDLKPLKKPPVAIGIFRPEEMAELLKHAKPALRPFLAIGAFAGLRHAEILRLDWREVDLAGGHIELKAQKAKTAARRLVPIAENLKKWLAPDHQGSGKVVRLQEINHLIHDVSKASGVKWQHNALRHSYISYRVAQVQNVAQVSIEAGNSPQIIFRNYRELVKPAEAVKWFAIEPEMPENVIPAPMVAAA